MSCPDYRLVKDTPIFSLGPKYPGTNTRIETCKRCKECTWYTIKEIIGMVDDIETATHKDLPDLPYRGYRFKAKPFCIENKQFIFQKARIGQCDRW
jgi:rRNA maturation protein Nop10